MKTKDLPVYRFLLAILALAGILGASYGLIDRTGRGDEVSISGNMPISADDGPIKIPSENGDGRSDTSWDHSSGDGMASVVGNSGEPFDESSRSVDRTVPFISQAPLAQWDDLVFQNGCEEASILMASAWLEGREAIADSPEAASILIRDLSARAQTMFGPDAYDTSAEDTADLFREYFRTSESPYRITVKNDVTLDGLRRTIEEGNIVIAPVDGRSLANPHYTAPGPEHHMLVIIGIDPTTREFITNDPGTRFGAGWRYGEDRLYDSIRDYPTGDHLPTQERRKDIVVVGRSV